MEGDFKYTKSLLAKLETLVAESDYILRYERGHFKSGYCILRQQKLILISKFYSMEGRIGALLDILKTLLPDTQRFTPETQRLYQRIIAPSLAALVADGA